MRTKAAMSSVRIEIDEALAALLHQTNQPVQAAAREMIVLELYRRGAISSGKAADLLSISRLAFIQHASKLGIPYLEMTDDVMKAQTGEATAASVLAAFKAAKDIPMNDIIKPWTPSAYVSAGSLSSIFSNVSNPWMYNITYDGTNTSTSPSDLFNTFKGLPGTTPTTGG